MTDAISKNIKAQLNFGRLFLIGIAIFIVLIMISLYVYNPSLVPGLTVTTTTTTQTGQSAQSSPPTGSVVIAFKDKSQKVEAIGTLNELLITVTKLEVNFVDQSSDTNATGEWKTVFEGSKRVDLLTLTDISGIVGQKELPSGKYSQVRLDVEDVVFNLTNTLLNVRNKRYSATVTNSSDVVNGELRFIHPFNITANETTMVTVDFDIQHSAARTSDGYTLKPVVKITDEILEQGTLPENSTMI